MYDSTWSFTKTVSSKMSWTCMFLYKRMKLVSIKEMHLADVLRELPCRICEFLFLKLPCCMKCVRKSKELEFCCVTFKTHAHYIFVNGFFYFQFNHKMWLWFWSQLPPLTERLTNGNVTYMKCITKYMLSSCWAKFSTLYCYFVWLYIWWKGILKFRVAVVENELVSPYRFAKS